MTDKNKWLEPISDFFLKDNNWEIACETVVAVEQIEEYWKNKFWSNVKVSIENKLTVTSEWEIECDDDAVNLYPIKNGGKVDSNCCIGVSCDDEDNGYFYIWVNTNEYSLAKNSKNYSGLKKIIEQFNFTLNEDLSILYLSNVAKDLSGKYSDRRKLIDLVKTESSEQRELVSKTIKIIVETDIHQKLINFR